MTQHNMNFVRKLFGDSKPDAFDLKHGVRTGGHVPRWRLLLSSFNAIHGVHYQPIGEKALCAAIDFLDEDYGQFNFVDLGCGKGRALVIAERYNFRRIIGVEYNKPMVEIARRNVKKATIVHADAATFKFPDGGLILFLYNPFSAKVMSEVVANLAVHRGHIYVLYCNPKCADLFSGMEPMGEIPGAHDFFAWKRSASISNAH